MSMATGVREVGSRREGRAGSGDHARARRCATSVATRLRCYERRCIAGAPLFARDLGQPRSKPAIDRYHTAPYCESPPLCKMKSAEHA